MPMSTPFRKALALAALCLVAAPPPLAGCSRRSAEAPPPASPGRGTGDAAPLAARDEYVAFLRERGVRAEYLEELVFVLPGDPRRMVCLADNDPRARPTATDPLVVVEETQEQDYSRLTPKVHGVDLWNGSDMCRDSRVLGPPPAAADALRAWHRDCRDFALRQTAYHELTHALQRAYVNRHLAPEECDNRASWSDSSKALYTLERAWFWRWGGHDAIGAVANHGMADERQSDGVSFQVLVRAGGLSDAQAKAVWDHWFGRLSDARDLLLRIRDRFDRQWPEYPADDFGGALFDVFSGQPGAQRMALKLSALPAYVGYLQPMRPEESDTFWQALREP